LYVSSKDVVKEDLVQTAKGPLPANDIVQIEKHDKQRPLPIKKRPRLLFMLRKQMYKLAEVLKSETFQKIRISGLDKRLIPLF
jgi:hypothetical protein